MRMYEEQKHTGHEGIAHIAPEITMEQVDGVIGWGS